jgi:hypothetical protein
VENPARKTGASGYTYIETPAETKDKALLWDWTQVLTAKKL